MQQLSSRDCDKWLRMTLTMKERFSSAGRGGEREIREKGRPEKANKGESSSSRVLLPLWLPGCIGSESDTLKPRTRFW